MELLYLYIERFNHIKEQEFHFSSEFDIHFDKEVNKLTFNTSTKPIIKLFSEGFLNINAIIGKNGSGKTSVLSFIQTLFCQEFFHHNRFILVFKESNHRLLIVNKLMNGQNALKCETNHEPSTYNVIEDIGIVQNSIYLISQSNSFSIYEDEIMGAHYLDISFDRLIDMQSRRSNNLLIDRYELLIDSYKEKVKDDDFNTQKKVLVNSILARNFLYQFDLVNSVNFVSKYKNKDWRFIPELLDISYNYNFFDNNIEYLKQVGLSEQLKNFEYLLFRKTISFPNELNSFQLFKDNLILMLYIYCLKIDQYYYPHSTQISESIKKINERGTIDNLILMVTEFFRGTIEQTSNEIFNQIREFINNIDEKLNFSENQFREVTYLNSFSFIMTDRVNTFIQFIFKVWLDNDFIFNFRWHGLSAGESALLNMFSRIHAAAKYDQFKETIWILIDEGELYLHPEWQRTFLFDLHKFLPDFFEGKKIQLFLTSHSPFLVSDLPAENLILMDKDENGWGIVVDKKRLGSTFGANIHTLFTDAFFLKNGLMGEFARNKIDTLIKMVNEKDQYTMEDYERLKNEINIIGEPFIRFKLLEKIMKGLPPEQFDAVLMEKEREVELLKKIRR